MRQAAQLRQQFIAFGARPGISVTRFHQKGNQAADR